MGIKILAYKIKKKVNGYIFLFNYELKPEVISTLKEDFKIRDGILRFNIIRL